MCFPRVPLRFLAILLFLPALGACDRHGLEFIVAPEFNDTFTFETGLSDWTGYGKDLTNPTDTWEVVRSGDRASQGSQSVRFQLTNPNSQGKLWIERKYAVQKNLLYKVDITFDFGSADFGSVNLWKVLAGATGLPPVAAALESRDSSGNGQATDQGFKFVPKVYSTEALSDVNGNLYVYVGVWGTGPETRTYYVDNISVVLTRKGISEPR